MSVYHEFLVSKKFKGYFMTKQRVVFEGAVYHITQRAPGRELIFLETADYLHFLKILKEITKEFSLQVFVFALLPNHLHLLLQITKKNLSSSMKMLFGTYAAYFNKKYKRKGHVFCGRFRASVCLDDSYLLTESIYIHLNPLRAELCKDFKDYRWTSIRLYLEAPKTSFVQPSRILSVVHQDLQQAREQYAKLLVCGAELENKADRKDVKKELKEMLRALKNVLGVREQKDVSQPVIFQKNKRIGATEDQRSRRYLIEQLLADDFDR